MGSMEPGSKEYQTGMRWLLIGLPVSVLLTVFLYQIDKGLTFSSRERDLSQTLHELRSAQNELGAGVSDEREVVGLRVARDAAHDLSDGAQSHHNTQSQQSNHADVSDRVDH